MTVRRFHAEIGTAIATGALGVAAIIGASELGYGWEGHGPQAGYFPFYVGLILIGASLWNLVGAVLRHREAMARVRAALEIEEPFLQREHLGRIGTFLAAMAGFVIGTVTLGVYVSSLAYIAWSAWRQGGYRLWVALAIGAGFSVVQYVIFEVIFRIPLLKGPIEPLLGIY
ncbi:tripartite tricarboxylate transporter TctB family protein [Paracoccus siganidrum]|uniref:Tripartite tricarboxylate transporter TctB family protein n=1 Tax=Paracoccus siganidrum TaxID=1276757 RepID=A0A419A7D1_9RHOB|nr:tripartite tricarboxylate transporter TctB family protein [Paracoccus siganidrum]RJL16486.1 tripartite tricarboxylate transporter TctB family protein [Paracoccus siganidrum]RMC38225.1 tripartite tricarboxylate transporter TctB family protein [Paracoccus siganidrum]